jgi:predicted amidohydrolase YtcJ
MSTARVPADVVVRNAVVHTLDPAMPRAEAFAVLGERFVVVGNDADVEDMIGTDTRVLDAAGGLVMPGLVDVHSHVGFGGQQAAWELTLPPAANLDQVLQAVRDRASTLGADDWVVGGIVISPVFQSLGSRDALAALDKASLGRPVLLRDDSLHNRWANSRALEIMGVDAASQDPPGGRYVRDPDGLLVGQLLEQASTAAELAVRRSMRDPHERDLVSARTAVSIFNSVGVTATQDAATMGAWLDVFAELDRAGELNAWLVGSLPAREFIESGPVGVELFESAGKWRGAHVRPDFVKAVLDGVPMTRTSKFLEPYKPDPWAPAPDTPSAHQCAFSGNALFTDEELLDVLDAAVSRGLHAKLHATADGTVRQVLDTVAILRERYGERPVFHIAHPEFIHRDDVVRFRELDVVADASPVLWFPNPMNDIIAMQVHDHYMDRIWPLRELRDAGVLLAAGSDWPVAMAAPNPWLSIETMVTRRSPDPSVPGTLGADQAIDLDTAIRAHTVNPARAMGLDQEIGRIKTGFSADFILPDQNIFEVPAARIHATQLHQTWFAGRCVYDATARS